MIIGLSGYAQVGKDEVESFSSRIGVAWYADRISF